MGKTPNFFAFIVLLLGSVTFLQAQEESAASLYNDGLSKLKAKEYQAAVDLLEKSIEIADPEEDKKVLNLAKKNSAFAYYYIGNSLRKQKKYDEAIEAYEKGIEHAKIIYNNFVGRAQALEGKGEDVEAVKAYIAAAGMAKKAKKEERAKKYLAKADNFSAVSYGKKDYDKAIAAAQAFLEDNESADSHYYLAMSLKEKNESSKALEHIGKAIELAGAIEELEADDRDKFFFGKAEIHESLGQKSQAVSAYKMIKGSKYKELAQYKVDELSGGGR